MVPLQKKGFNFQERGETYVKGFKNKVLMSDSIDLTITLDLYILVDRLLSSGNPISRQTVGDKETVDEPRETRLWCLQKESRRLIGRSRSGFLFCILLRFTASLFLHGALCRNDSSNILTLQEIVPFLSEPFFNATSVYSVQIKRSITVIEIGHQPTQLYRVWTLAQFESLFCPMDFRAPRRCLMIHWWQYLMSRFWSFLTCPSMITL